LLTGTSFLSESHRTRSRRRSLITTAAVASLAVFLTGCGRSDTTASDSPGAVIDDAPATGTVEIWAAGNEGDFLPELAASFEADNPDVTINVTQVPFGDFDTKLQTAIASGSVPDMTYVFTSNLTASLKSGAFETVPDGLVDPSSFYDGAVDAVMAGDQMTAVPWYVETRALFYRSDLAAEAGAEAPATWEEVVPFFEALQAAGAEYGTGMDTVADQYTAQAVTPFVWQAGGDLLSADGSEWTLDTPEAIAGFSQYQSYFTSGAAPETAPAFGEIEGDIVSGRIGSVISGPWEFAYLEEAGGEGYVADNIGVTTLPAGPGGNESLLDGGDLVVFKEANNRDAAWKFTRWLASPETQADWYEIAGVLPANVDAWDSPALQATPGLAVLDEQLASARALPLVTTWPEVAVIVGAAAEKVAHGTSPAEALTEAQSKAEAVGVGD
jgi:multiple sugar transport system substrate-binding protein